MENIKELLANETFNESNYLMPREEFVLKGLYVHGLSYETLAKHMNVTEERIMQIEVKGLHKCSRFLKPFVESNIETQEKTR